MLANSHAGGDAPAFHLEVSQSTQYKRILSVQMLRPADFLVFRVLLMIQFDLPGLRGSCVASTYSVEDGPNPVI